MTEKDLKLIEEAKMIYLNHQAIADMIRQADTEEAKEILGDLENTAFIRSEQSYFDTID